MPGVTLRPLRRALSNPPPFFDRDPEAVTSLRHGSMEVPMARKSTLLFGGLLAAALAPVTVGMLPLGGHATTSAATLASAHAGHAGHAAAAPVPSGDDP